MIRVQIKRKGKQVREDPANARRNELSTDVVCRESSMQRDVEDKRRAALAVIGKYRSGLSDLARKHDWYLDEAHHAD